MRVLFLDDRIVRVEEFLARCPDARVVRNARDCLAALSEADRWDIVFLDHDLNDEHAFPVADPATNHGTHVAEWIVAHRPRIGRIVIHSTNGDAAQSMFRLLHSTYDVVRLPFDERRWHAACNPHRDAHFTTLTSTAFDRTYYEQHKAAGLDYAHFGGWQRNYAAWLVDALGLHGRSLLDIGCACGNMAAAFAERGLSAVGVDVCEHMINLGRQRFPGVRLEICDAANLHLFGAGCFGMIHSHQSAEHWPVDLVPRILREARHVAAADALFFCVLDTTDLADRSGRDLAAEDPTHVCLRPLSWWREQLAAAGWRWANEEFRHGLAEHEKSYLVDYDWDWWVCRSAH